MEKEELRDTLLMYLRRPGYKLRSGFFTDRNHGMTFDKVQKFLENLKEEGIIDFETDEHGKVDYRSVREIN